jgi:hypothetical protein
MQLEASDNRSVPNALLTSTLDQLVFIVVPLAVGLSPTSQTSKLHALKGKRSSSSPSANLLNSCRSSQVKLNTFLYEVVGVKKAKEKDEEDEEV